jgi:hypothetical protein
MTAPACARAVGPRRDLIRLATVVTASTTAPRRQYRLSYPTGLVLVLKAKYGLKLIGEQPSGRLEGARSELRGHGARAWRAAPAQGGAAVSAARVGVTNKPY